MDCILCGLLDFKVVLNGIYGLDLTIEILLPKASIGMLNCHSDYVCYLV